MGANKLEKADELDFSETKATVKQKIIVFTVMV